MKSWLLLLFALLSLSQAGNIIRFCEMTPEKVSFYRLLGAALIMFPLASMRIKRTIEIICKNWGKIVLMGLFFALHFITWIGAVQGTKIANAATCLALSPLFISVGSFFFLKEPLTKKIIISILLGFIGVIIIGIDDLDLNSNHLYGDTLALVSALFFSCYFLLGKSLRKRLDNLSLMSIVYIIGAMVSLIFIFVSGESLGGINNGSWLALAVLVIFPTLLGHGSMIYVMKDFSAGFISTLTLIEPLLAGVFALIIFGEVITVSMIFGYLFIVSGLLVLIYCSKA